MPTCNYGGKSIKYDAITDWKSYVSSGTDDGENSWNNLSDATVKGIPGTLGLLIALGFTPTLTSGWRSEAANANCGGAGKSQHMLGAAIDICCEPESEEFYENFANNMANAGFWAYGLGHEGTGWHIHLDNYQGGLNDETAEQKKALIAQNQRSGGEYMKGDGSTAGHGNTPAQHGFQVRGTTVKIMPDGKTFAEPVYPDLIYVAGNIPNSVVEKAVEKDNTTSTDKNSTGGTNNNGRTNSTTATTDDTARTDKNQF